VKARVGIGVLSWAHGHVGAYAGMIRSFDDARLVSCWDHDAARGRANANKFAIPYFEDIGKVLGNPEVECVMIGSETNRHADLCEAAAKAGKAILLQKPMAITLEECDRIIRAVKHSGIWFSLAWQMRSDPQNIRMRELVRDGAVGRVGIVRRRHCIGLLFDKGFVEGPARWHLDRTANRGMWADDASHACDWLLWMFGKPSSVIAEIDNVLKIGRAHV
jgi:predicted dehydrogenase